jgi:membrane associated rhomboid family serine protease
MEMKYSEQQYKERLALGQPNNNLLMLIAVCLVMFVGLAFMKAIWYFRFPKEIAPDLFNKNVLGWFAMPASLHNLAAKPWTILTNFFIHDNVWKVFSNMLWLWCFGYILHSITGNRKIVPVFIYGGLAGSIGFLLAYQFVPSLQSQLPYETAMGAAPGVMALAVTTTMISPRYKIFPLVSGGIPLWALTALYIIIDLATISISDTALLISHLSGALMGVIFISFLRRGYDWSEWMSNFFDWINNLFNPDKPKRGRSIKEELFYKTSAEPFRKTPNVTQQRIDEILDKINQKGYDFLTEEEKNLLRRAAEEEL